MSFKKAMKQSRSALFAYFDHGSGARVYKVFGNIEDTPVT